MDGAFQTMAPVGENVSVVSGMNGAATVGSVGSQGMDFFQILLMQLGSAFQPLGQEGMSDFFSLQLPVTVAEDGDFVGEAAVGQDSLNGFMADGLPFPFYVGEEQPVISTEETSFANNEEVLMATISEAEVQAGSEGAVSYMPVEEAPLIGDVVVEDSGMRSETGDAALSPEYVFGFLQENTQSDMQSGPSVPGNAESVPAVPNMPEATVADSAPVVSGEETLLRVSNAPPLGAMYEDTGIEDIVAGREDVSESDSIMSQLFEKFYLFDNEGVYATQMQMENNELDLSQLMKQKADMSKSETATSGRLGEAAFADVVQSDERDEAAFFGYEDEGGDDDPVSRHLAEAEKMANSQGETEEAVSLEKVESEKHFQSILDKRVQQAQEAQSVAQQIIKSAHLRQAGAVSEFTLSLEPEYLGSLKISVLMQNDTVMTRISAESAYTRDLLTDNLSMLKSALKDAGIKFDDIEVSMQDHEQQQNFDDFIGDGDSSKGKTGQKKTSDDALFSIPGFDDQETALGDAELGVESTKSALPHVTVDFLV